MNKKILLIDGNSLIFRAYFASAYGNKTILKTSKNVPTNAVYGFTNMVVSLLNAREYFDVKVAFDKGRKTFRHTKMETYKAGRAKTPDELLEQLPIARELLTAMGVDWFELDNYEADDIIGMIDKYIESTMPDAEVEILTSDKDMFQLISPQTKILIPNSGTSDLTEFGLEELKTRWCCTPEQVADLKGLMGDSSDNLKGVGGIGEKTAIKLICEYGNLEGIYQNLDQIRGATKEKLIKDKESAFLSREMAVIATDFPIANLKFQKLELNLETLTSFLLKYEMFSIVKRLGLQVTPKNEEKILVKTLKLWSKDYEAEKNAVFVQSLENNYHKDKIIGIAISNEKGTFYLDKKSTNVQLSFFEEEEVTTEFDEELNAFFQNPKVEKTTYDIKKTITLLKNANYQIAKEAFVFDMMVAVYDLDPNVKSTFANHVKVIDRDVNIDEDEVVFGKGAKKTSEIDLELKTNFIGQKAYWISKLESQIIKKLDDNNQLNLYQNIDLPFVFVLYEMEQNGVLINRQELEKQTQESLLKIQELEKQAIVILQDVHASTNLNLSSPKQLQKLLFDDLKLPNLDKGSTSREVLEKLISAHPIINVLLEHRKYSKLYSTYLKGFEKYIFEDGKVHTIFNQTLTNTGRLSSIEPNLQNISVRDDDQKQVRKIFVAGAHHQFYSFDYSQIELRVLAQLAPEKRLLDIFKQHRDVHAETARQIYNLSATDTITHEMRRMAKVFNFGIIYGLSDFGLSKDFNIPIPKAREFIEKYYQTFPDILNFKKEVIGFAQTNGYVLTDGNRKRNIPELFSNNYQVKQFGERIAFNMPIQGTAADLLKVAMINIFKILQKNNFATKMVAQIHDEIIFEIPQGEIDIIYPTIVEEMKNSYSNLLKIVQKKTVLQVELEVSSSHGQNWFDLK